MTVEVFYVRRAGEKSFFVFRVWGDNFYQVGKLVGIKID